MNKNIIIIGAGGHSAEIDDYIRSNNSSKIQQYEVLGFLDDNPENYNNYKFSAPYLGKIDKHIVRSDVFYLMGIANLEFRKKIIEKFLNANAVFETLIHCTAYISPSAKIGKGVVIGPMVNIGPNVKIGDFNLINSRCSLGHDTTIGNYNFISPNVCFSGFTKIGDNNLFGINSATIPNIFVGNDNKIAAGMVLHSNVENDEIVFYRYKESIIAKPKSN